VDRSDEVASLIQMAGVAIGRVLESLRFGGGVGHSNFAGQEIRSGGCLAPYYVTFPAVVAIGGVQMYLRRQAGVRT
jgi:hypothetical protein